MRFQKTILLATLLNLSFHSFAEGLVSYVVQQGFMQGGMLLKAKSVDDVLKEENISPQTKHYLRLSKEIIHFAENDLKMNTAKNYRKFIQLDRPWVTQIVVAAYKDRLEPYLFEFPIIGKVPYKGYFKEEDAVRLQNELKDKNLDTYRRPVEAFSTTGWLPDPILSTMFSSEARFTELLFHELTHSTFYFESQADFNEAFASWMGFRSALEFIEKKASLFSNAAKITQELKEDHAFQLKLTRIIREVVSYARDFYKQPDAAQKRDELFSWIQKRFSKEAGFERYAKREWNNSLILGLATYYEMVEPIEGYAQKHQLSPKEFLQKVKQQGPSIIKEIQELK